MRCKIFVKTELERLGFHCTSVELGSAETIEMISAEQIKKIKAALSPSGLIVSDDKKSILLEKIKHIILEMIYHSDVRFNINFSDYLSIKLNLDYTYLANTFSREQHTTIEQFIILSKINRIKELIGYDELTLTEISWKLHYSSVAHLSTQFKKITGVTPSYFRRLNHVVPDAVN